MDGTHYATIGMDVSDRKTQVCVMAKDGKSPKIAMETVVPTTKEGLAKFLSTQDRSAPVAFETGMHCRWTNEAAEGPGFKVYAANPCRLRMTTESKTKNGVDDARMPARLALSDPGLLHPVKLRGPGRRRMPNLHEMRNLLVKRRTGVIVFRSRTWEKLERIWDTAEQRSHRARSLQVAFLLSETALHQ